jgi:hypothetical protein
LTCLKIIGFISFCGKSISTNSLQLSFVSSFFYTLNYTTLFILSNLKMFNFMKLTIFASLTDILNSFLDSFIFPKSGSAFSWSVYISSSLTEFSKSVSSFEGENFIRLHSSSILSFFMRSSFLEIFSMITLVQS